MWARSTDMHPARARPRACTGEGPARPSLSPTIAASPARPRKRRSPSQTSSTSTGGLAPATASAALHGREAGDALLEGRMGAEQAAEEAPRERVDDEHVRGGGIGVLHRDPLRGRLQLAQGARQAVGVADQARAALVRAV